MHFTNIPRRVPNLVKSGVILAKAADGTVTRAPERNPAYCQQPFQEKSSIDATNLPQRMLKAMKVLCLSILIQDNAKMPLANVHSNHVTMGPM